MLKKEDFPHKLVNSKILDRVLDQMFEGSEDEVRLYDLCVSAFEWCLEHRDCCNAFSCETDEKDDCSRYVYILSHHGQFRGLTEFEEARAIERLYEIREDLKRQGKLSEFYEAVEE